MQQIILIIITAFFLAAIIRQILYWTWLWQVKEYRADRLQAHFQDIGARSAFLALIGYSTLRQKRAPKFTIKAILIIFFSLLSGAVILFLLFQNFLPNVSGLDYLNFTSYQNFLLDNKSLLVYLVFGYLIMPVIIFLTVIILNGLSAIFKKIIIARAKAKIAKFPNLKVIGITGSYGKSTTKEILADILSKKYRVLKTPANVNTAIGIAQLILDKLDDSYEIFIVEMGAYKIGEIKGICDMARPKIGILTAINEQHLALFGKLENTIKAKFELIDSLPAEGLAILNIGNKNIEIGLENEKCISGDGCKIKARKKLYSVGAKADAYAINAVCTHQNIKFTFISGADMKDFTLNITGAHNISNALAAIIAAQEIGMNLMEISQNMQRISRLDFTLKISAGPNGSTLIDDTYNSNPNGVLAALEYVKSERGRKFIIISSLIELGASAHKIHRSLGKNISPIATKLFFLDNYYFADIWKGVLGNEKAITDIVLERDAQKIARILENELKPSDTALFINRGARKVLEELKNKK